MTDRECEEMVKANRNFLVLPPGVQVELAPPLKIGDTVQLRSGGPVMTVSEVCGDGDLECVWFASHEHPVQERIFPVAVLRLAQPLSNTQDETEQARINLLKAGYRGSTLLEVIEDCLNRGRQEDTRAEQWREAADEADQANLMLHKAGYGVAGMPLLERVRFFLANLCGATRKRIQSKVVKLRDEWQQRYNSAGDRREWDGVGEAEYHLAALNEVLALISEADE